MVSKMISYVKEPQFSIEKENYSGAGTLFHSY